MTNIFSFDVRWLKHGDDESCSPGIYLPLAAGGLFAVRNARQGTRERTAWSTGLNLFNSA